MSERAQKIFTWLQNQNALEFPIRQQSLAEQFHCSRRSIGRALKELKEAGLLVDLNKRHENRCKIYEVKIPPCAEASGGKPLTPQAEQLWALYQKTFRIVFTMSNLEELYAQVTWDLRGVTEERELWTKTFAGLWALTGTMPTEKVFDPVRKTWFFRLLIV